MITVYQIRLSDQELTQVNMFGHDATPKSSARIEMMDRGAKAWKPEYAQYYEPVYQVATDDLEQAYEATNLWECGRVTRLKPGPSSSVGDVFVTESGEASVVDTFGFEPVVFSTAAG
jgi:hypothetical protein